MTQLLKRYDRFTDTSLFHPYDDNPGVYLQSHVSVANGKLRFDCDQDGGWAGWFGEKNLGFGKYSIGIQGFGGDGLTGMVWEMWPVDDVWAHGEMCVAEANFQGETVTASHHEMGANPGNNFAQFSMAADWSQRHLYTIEWLPTIVRYYTDGALRGSVTAAAHIPPAAYPHRMTFQSKPAPGSAPAYALVDTVQFETAV